MLISNALPGLHVRFPVFSMLHIEKSPDSFFQHVRRTECWEWPGKKAGGRLTGSLYYIVRLVDWSSFHESDHNRLLV